jgi:hypothetical protein
MGGEIMNFWFYAYIMAGGVAAYGFLMVYLAYREKNK